MTLFKKLLCLTLALCTLLALAACGKDGQTPDNAEPTKEPGYRVSVTDYAGNPIAGGVIVCFAQNGQEVAMQSVNADGVAVKDLPLGDYTVSLKFTDSNANYYYDEADMTLSAEVTELNVKLAALPTASATVVHANTEYTAWYVPAGSTCVPLTPGSRNYFLFAPTEAGKYEIAVSGGLTIGYYGMPHFIQDNDLSDRTGETFTMSIKADMIGDSFSASLVLGVDANDAENCVITINRIGDPDWTVEDEPWIYYQPTAELSPYVLPAGALVKEFDLTAKYTLVYNEADGFYHLNTADGPLVLVRLGKDGVYLDSFKTILDKSGVCKYFFDENETFVKRESYDGCLTEYFQYMDEESGLYPLTEDLKYIIQQRGEYVGWFDPERPMYLFKDANGINIPGIDPETSWLFMCCYLAE